MNRKIISLVFIPVILFFFSATSLADEVELKNGDVVKGEITEETEQFIAVETDKGTSFIKKDEVKAVSRSQMAATTGTVVEVTGAVDVLPKGGEQWTPVQKGTVLNEGDSVRTGSDSKAIALLGNQAIMAVEPESNVGLNKLQQSPKKDIKVKVNLDRGQIWTDVGKLRTKDSKFHVATPAAVTGVRGTIFTVQAGPEKTTVAVVDGSVDVRTREMMEGPVRVKKNYMTEVTPNRPPAKPTAISGAFLAQWAIYQAKFGLLRSGMGGGFQVSPGQAAVGGAAVAGAAIAAAAAGGGGGGGSSPAAPQTVTVTASRSGVFPVTPTDTEIDGSPEIGERTVTRVDVSLDCNPMTVPDRFQVIYEGSPIADTGDLIGTPTTITGSAPGSSTIVTIRVISEGVGSEWHWDAVVTYHVE
ncbi:MAG: hypothetical protein C4520_19640 [Candidatus Abyssobacteria bacterium SURF_5]|uniref:FecR protein domain-containing protein n=1 Tax=Abyssobacteria bacterium (strain SURF_5) TaxID=2093360 RepID=A0A3A4N961_ABYX5|nr:MAG: hypothetical protein C4520_19640 [Candidatus Abyssubacteria bacterium SURF_5]